MFCAEFPPLASMTPLAEFHLQMGRWRKLRLHGACSASRGTVLDPQIPWPDMGRCLRVSWATWFPVMRLRVFGGLSHPVTPKRCERKGR